MIRTLEIDLDPARRTQRIVDAKTTLISRTADLIVEDVGEEALIYDTRSDVAHSLAATAAVVWRAARDGETLDGIVELLWSRGVAEPDEMAVAVLAELQEKDLLETRRFASPGISRRHALTRMAAVGAAAGLVPFVVSATVPKAEAAGSPASCKGVGVACSPAGSTYANNNCCKLNNGLQTDAMYCSSAAAGQKCTTCVATGSNPGGGCANGNGAADFRCCKGTCGTTSANKCD
jgi:hypothetical protein